MKILVKMLCLAAVSVSVAACACPRTDDYGRVPYTEERTAGEGVAVYGDDCHVKTKKSSKMKKIVK